MKCAGLISHGVLIVQVQSPRTFGLRWSISQSLFTGGFKFMGSRANLRFVSTISDVSRFYQ